jgi:hypothetical protein
MQSDGARNDGSRTGSHGYRLTACLLHFGSSGGAERHAVSTLHPSVVSRLAAQETIGSKYGVFSAAFVRPFHLPRRHPKRRTRLQSVWGMRHAPRLQRHTVCRVRAGTAHLGILELPGPTESRRSAPHTGGLRWRARPPTHTICSDILCLIERMS